MEYQTLVNEVKRLSIRIAKLESVGFDDSDDVYEFVEPHVTGGRCVVRLQRKTIINNMRTCEQHKTKRKLTTDDELVDEFCTTHYAYKIKSSKSFTMRHNVI
jgi:hypothetical protein